MGLAGVPCGGEGGGGWSIILRRCSLWKEKRKQKRFFSLLWKESTCVPLSFPSRFGGNLRMRKKWVFFWEQRAAGVGGEAVPAGHGGGGLGGASSPGRNFDWECFLNASLPFVTQAFPSYNIFIINI